MGMDVYGTNEDTYFRNSVWWWHPLTNYIYNVAPDISSKCDYWHSNYGDGLNDTDSLRLANILQFEINSGRIQKYADKFQKTNDDKPTWYFSVENVQEFVISAADFESSREIKGPKR